MILVLKVIHHFICVFGYFCWGPYWPLSCNNPPNGQISPHGDTKQMRPRPSFCRPQHMPATLFCRISSSQRHPSLHKYVWLLQLGSDWPLDCNNPTQRTTITTLGHQANRALAILPPPPAHAHRILLPQIEFSKLSVTSYMCLVTSVGVLIGL